MDKKNRDRSSEGERKAVKKKKKKKKTRDGGGEAEEREVNLRDLFTRNPLQKLRNPCLEQMGKSCWR